MIYLLSWRGRGAIALPLLFLPVGFMLAGYAIGEDAGFVGFAIGWLVSGALCYVLGRRWNRGSSTHQFCGLRLQTWGIIYGVIGLFLGWLAVEQALMSAQLRRPTRRVPPVTAVMVHERRGREVLRITRSRQGFSVPRPQQPSGRFG